MTEWVKIWSKTSRGEGEREREREGEEYKKCQENPKRE